MFRSISRPEPHFSRHRLLRQQRSTPARYLLLGCGAVFGAFGDRVFSGVAMVWAAAVILCGVTALAAAAARRRSVHWLLDPVVAIVGYFALKYGVGSIVVKYWANYPWLYSPGTSTVFERWDTQTYLPFACQLFIVAGLGLLIGSSLRPPRVTRIVPPLSWPTDERRFALRALIYSVPATFLFVFGRDFLPLVIRDTVLLLGWFTWVLVARAGYMIGRERATTAWWMTLVLIWLAGAGSGFATGMRGAFLYPFVLAFMGYVLSNARIRWVPLAGLTAVLIVVAIPWLTFYKTQSDANTVSTRVSRASEVMANMPVRGWTEQGIETAFGRFFGVAAMAPVFVQEYPERRPFERGETFVLEAIQAVPRVMWPAKPNVSELLNAYSHKVGIIDEDDQDTSAVFDGVSEYYINFGLLGVFVFSVIQGWYWRVLHHWLIERSALSLGAPIFFVLIFINFDCFGIVQTLVSHSRLLPVWILVLFSLSQSVRSSEYRFRAAAAA